MLKLQTRWYILDEKVALATHYFRDSRQQCSELQRKFSSDVLDFKEES